MLRWIAVVVGTGLLAATAHVTIVKTGGYATPHAVLTMAIAFGVAIGALAIGSAWAHGRYSLALIFAIALICGESFALLRTAERLVESREQAQAPLRLKQQERIKAEKRVDRAEEALQTFSPTSPRLTAALAGKAAADRAVVEQAALRGCRKNCRALLEQQVRDAGDEVRSARAAVETKRQGLEAELKTARAALAAMPTTRSGTPLADRLQIEPWVLDLLMAALGGIGANGLGAALLAFGGHGRPARVEIVKPAKIEPVPTPVEQAPAPKVQAKAKPKPAQLQKPKPKEEPAPALSDKKVAERFCMETLQPKPGAHAPLPEVHATYLQWCKAKELEPLAPREIAAILQELFTSVNMRIDERNGTPSIIDVEIKQSTALVKAA